MIVSFSDIEIKAIAAALPLNSVECSSFSDIFGEEEVKRIIAKSGIERVRVVPPEVCVSDLCVVAAENLCENMALDRSSIDGIVFVSECPDYQFPATSVILQHRLKLSNNIAAIDINHGCSGYIYGLYQAAMMIKAGGCRRILLLVGDAISPLIHPGDRTLRMIVGDAGSATLVEGGVGRMSFHIKTDGSAYMHFIRPAGGARNPFSPETSIEHKDADGNTRTENNVYMNGYEIMNFVLREVPGTIEAVLKESGWRKAEVDTFALHQASKFILEQLTLLMKLEPESVPMTMVNTGNAGCASIPLLLSSRYSRPNNVSRLRRVVMSGFGTGLSVGAVTADLSCTTIIAPVEV